MLAHLLAHAGWPTLAVFLDGHYDRLRGGAVACDSMRPKSWANALARDTGGKEVAATAAKRRFKKILRDCKRAKRNARSLL